MEALEYFALQPPSALIFSQPYFAKSGHATLGCTEPTFPFVVGTAVGLRVGEAVGAVVVAAPTFPFT
jgi:hypothetical protein